MAGLIAVLAGSLFSDDSADPGGVGAGQAGENSDATWQVQRQELGFDRGRDKVRIDHSIARKGGHRPMQPPKAAGPALSAWMATPIAKASRSVHPPSREGGYNVRVPVGLFVLTMFIGSSELRQARQRTR
jgi:hypothetical protein